MHALAKICCARDPAEGISRRDPPRRGCPRGVPSPLALAGDPIRRPTRGALPPLSPHTLVGGHPPLSWRRRDKGREMQDLGEERCRICTSVAHASTRGRPTLPLPGASAAVRPLRLCRVDLREGIGVGETWRSCVEEMETWAPSARKVGQGGPTRVDEEDFFQGRMQWILRGCSEERSHSQLK
jgi:hypothetical protein